MSAYKVIVDNIFRDGFALESLTLIPCFHSAEVTTKIQCLQLFSRKTFWKREFLYTASTYCMFAKKCHFYSILRSLF